jgi:peptidoglycan/LPS O-acetylase OafA/YrhL
MAADFDTRFLTRLRGVAALLVVISHSANAGLLPALVGNGLDQVGVALFFVLSGHLMGLLYLHQPYDATIAG